MSRNGFILLEAMVTCALVMLTWFFITQCAVQALTLEAQIEKKVTALIAASTTLEKLRAGRYALRDQTITQGDLQIIVSCQQKLYNGLLYIVQVKVTADTRELVCLKSALLRN